MFTEQQSGILKTFDHLIELSNDDTTKKAIIEASKLFINYINMATIDQKQGGLDGLLKVIASALMSEAVKEVPALINLGEKGIVKLLHPHKRKIAAAAAVIEPCPAGYTRDSDGVCQKDPVPPDPTHQ